jgi:hypothetical protein
MARSKIIIKKVLDLLLKEYSMINVDIETKEKTNGSYD